MNAATSSSSKQASFSPRMIAAVVAIGTIAFIAIWLLTAFGPQLSSGNDARGHALSKAAPGYAAMVDLLERSGATVELRRKVEPYRYSSEDKTLLILTPRHDSEPADIEELVKNAGQSPVLIVLPKWHTIKGGDQQKVRPDWAGIGWPIRPPSKLLPESKFGKVEIDSTETSGGTAVAALSGRSEIVTLPKRAQTVSGDDLETLLAAPDGSAILARAKSDDVYVLAEPDLINNLAFASREKARAGAMLLDGIAQDGDVDAMAFDLTLNGFGSGRSLMRFAFVPPFIGITLCLFAAFLLALWQAWARFGPPIRPLRSFPVSKAALITNSADLVKQAGRELDGAATFIQNQRIAIARRLHAPAGLDAEATDAWIDKRLPPDSDSFSELACRLPLARSVHEYLADAQALQKIRKDLLRDS